MKGCGPLADTNAKFTAVYLHHIKHTLPWLDEGVRILPSGLYLDYTQEIKALTEDAMRSVESLEQQWSGLVANDIARLGSLGDPANYPASITPFYSATIRFLPVPAENDFRIAISDDDKAELTKAIHEAENAATKYLLEQIKEPLVKLQQRCIEYQGGQGERWHAGLVDNLFELTDRLPQLNINDDAGVTEILESIRASMLPYVIQPTKLKESRDDRDIARQKLDEIMSRMGAFMV